MSPNYTPQNQRLPSERARMLGRRWILTLAAVALLAVSGSAVAQIPALPVSADHRSDISTPAGQMSVSKSGNYASACANVDHRLPALPVALPMQMPNAKARACADADLDKLSVKARAGANTYGIPDPTGLIPSHLGARASADVDDKQIDFDAKTDSHTVQGVLDTATGALKSAWSTVRGLLP